MKNFLLSKKQSITVAASGLVSVLMVAGIVYSATTISTNVNTGGTLTVSGASTLTGAVAVASSTPSDTAMISVQGNVYIAGNLMNVSNITATGTLSVTGASTLTGAITTGSTLGVSTSTPFALVGNSLAVQGSAYISGALVNVSNITATGTLAVTGATTLSSTLGVTGLTTLGFASSSGISISTGANSLMVSGTATTTGSSGQFATQGFIGAGGTSTPAAELSATSAATTTLYLDTSGTKKGSCIELVRSTDGTVFRLYVGTTTLNNFNTTVLQVEAGSCK
ncbi:hypothetical protein A2661_00315 [Candidatus Giovannonibacteria bacterium RIFCSPHIGHO2_01_FULL_45_24]|uniref:Uncharacterized protein n=1 Tax=Candidatus Giovannonibacteria bacterium RIFCSPLOWO2_01_FULL_46_32 TaxID=1798353 RepID=A0A1F5XGF4_9BACT|nr:MAG: hypothetical protein A2661_00315 [Candidatus Giovannonibacteria bacterium RIFCSPHIGHO2_01_FULL_45_24]OGF87022.1 MAG: hypothetical protein A3B19_01155 [Candidatus Giovannonibacteria bacterium RIFCSPLOWO2_01_FULL_46_32]